MSTAELMKAAVSGAFLVKNPREWMSGRLQNETPSAADMMHGRILSGEDAGMRRRREGRLGNRALEQHPGLRKAVEIGRLDLLIAVAVQVIGTQRIDRDDHNVKRASFSFRSRLTAARRARERGQQNEQTECSGARPKRGRKHDPKIPLAYRVPI